MDRQAPRIECFFLVIYETWLSHPEDSTDGNTNLLWVIRNAQGSWGAGRVACSVLIKLHSALRRLIMIVISVKCPNLETSFDWQVGDQSQQLMWSCHGRILIGLLLFYRRKCLCYRKNEWKPLIATLTKISTASFKFDHPCMTLMFN